MPRYAPLLLAKRGELQAVKKMAVEARDAIAPVFLIPSVGVRWVGKLGDPPARTKTLDQHIVDSVKAVARVWGSAPVRCDTFHLEDDEEIGSMPVHPIRRLVEMGDEAGVEVIPTIGPERTDAAVEAARDAAACGRRGACIRLRFASMVRLAMGDQSELRSLLADLRLSVNKVDLLLDLGSVSREIQPLRSYVCGALTHLPAPRLWRSITMASAAFPKDLSECRTDAVTSLPRWDWMLYRALVADSGDIERMPDYADYGVAHPEPTEENPKGLSMSANLRYTCDDCWHVAKGRSVDHRPEFDKVYRLARALVDSGCYRGPAFSWGDGWIIETAGELDGPGNASEWRAVGTSHHLAVVLAQLADVARG